VYKAIVFHYLDVAPVLSAGFDEAYVDAQARALGEDVVELWNTTKGAACRKAEREG
jgi:hypothetical protein